MENKYIKLHNMQLNESTDGLIPMSVIFINGKKNKDGIRYLYATNIKNYIQIAHHAVMVYLGNTVYRVYKDGDVFKGAIIDYGPDMIKLFNIKNINNPSLVLNKHKTPFHYSTRKFTRISEALNDLSDMLKHENYDFSI